MTKVVLYDPKDSLDKFIIIRQYNIALTRYFRAIKYLKVLIDFSKTPTTKLSEIKYMDEIKRCIKVTKNGVKRLHAQVLYYDKLREIWWTNRERELCLNIQSS